jgi:TolB-like protein/DNA-binding winged helix-turn-helix (wHTH) protein/Tfp pilus assembly protein PilF
MATSTRQAYEFGQFRLDPTERTLLRQGEPVALTPKVFDTLIYLVENSGRLITKDEFMKQVWADAFVEEATLAQSISQLRKALGNSEIVETVPKKGYRFLGKVTTVEAAAQTVVANPPAVEATAPALERASGRVASNREKTLWIWAVASAALLLAVVLFVVHERGARPRPSIGSLAVLPLQNLSGDPNQEYFADGMTDELITDLAQIHSLRVISHTSVIQFKHTQKSLPEIAAQLNVDAVVEGSVLRTGNDVRITAQLLDAREDRHLWAASYEREIANVLDLQRQVARTIADQVNAKLTPQEGAALAKQQATNPAAYDALLIGRFLFNRRNPADTEKAITYFQKAAELDPNNAQAWASLAYANASLGSDLGIASRAKVLPPAQAAIGKALEIDPNLAEAHTILAWIKLWYDWDWSGAEREFRRSLELNPNDSVAHREYSHYLQVRKRFDEALEENKRAIDLAPLDILPSIHLAWLYADARDGAKAVEQSKHVLEMDPSFSGAYLMMASGYIVQRDWDDALAALKNINNYPQDVEAGVAYIRAASGNKTQAQAAIAKLTEFSRHNYVSPVTFATCYAATGEQDRAFDWLEKAYKERAPGLISLEVNSGLDNLRSDPRFHELERRVGF